MLKPVLATLFFSSVALAQPKIVLSPVKHLYIPDGFDSNDSVEVVVTGTFPNLCYSRNTVNVKVDGERVDITVTAISPNDDDNIRFRVCPAMLIPFKEVVSVGNLQGGDYEVSVNSTSPAALKDTLKVAEASSNSVDDSIYAAIDYVQQVDEDDFVLKGWRYSNCMNLDKIKVVSNGKDTLSVLPIMKQVGTHCPMKGMPVSYPVKLDFSKLKTDEPLIHVRTMDGKSVNSVVNLE